MPKKFKQENTKSAEARARKDAQKAAERERVEKAKEDEFWRDDDKHLAKKQQRKDDKEAKRLEQIERKKELQKLHEEEMSSLKGAKPQQQQKITRAQIMEQQERQDAMAAAAASKKLEEAPLEENLNRLTVDGDEARNVDEAISILRTSEPGLDRHPEKRMKAAYNAFEEARLPVLKQENSNMRLSQLKQMLKKEWMKSPDNPLNQRHASFNS